MVNYANGKIYQISAVDAVEGDADVYIGSTTKQYLSQRMDCHRRDYVQWKKGNIKVGKVSSFDIFDKHNINNCRIILLETFPCQSRDELTSREAFYIRSIKCVNKMIPDRTKKQYRDEHKEIYREQQKVKRICECGAVLNHDKLTRHKRTAKHIDAIAAAAV